MHGILGSPQLDDLLMSVSKAFNIKQISVQLNNWFTGAEADVMYIKLSI